MKKETNGEGTSKVLVLTSESVNDDAFFSNFILTAENLGKLGVTVPGQSIKFVSKLGAYTIAKLNEGGGISMTQYSGTGKKH